MTTAHLNSPEESKVLADVQAAIAAGKDPFDDDDDAGEVATTGTAEDQAAIDAAAAEAAQAEAGQAAAAQAAAQSAAEDGAAANTPAGDDLSVDALEAIVGDKADPTPMPVYEVPQASDIETQRKALRDQQKQVEKDWAAGNLSDDERIDKLDALTAQRDALLAQEIEARTISRLNADGERQSQQRVLDTLAVSSARAGEIDYLKDPTASAAFNAMLEAVKADPANAGKPYAEIAEKTHDALCAVRGITRKAPAAAPAPAAQPAKDRTTPPIPTTLRGLPNASTPNTGGDWKDDMAKLSGAEWEEAFAKLPQARKDELLS